MDGIRKRIARAGSAKILAAALAAALLVGAAPLIQDAGAAAPFSITSGTLPAATQGRAYIQTLHATGGIAPYRWKKLSKLPAGLKLTRKTGVIAGVPKRAGTVRFSVRAAYATGSQPRTAWSPTKVLSITVVAGAGGGSGSIPAFIPGGYPNASNTGYQRLLSTCPGGVLKVYPSSQYYLSALGVANGGTLSCAEIRGDLLFDRSNVHIDRSWIWGISKITSYNLGGRGAVITDTEMGGPDPSVDYGRGSDPAVAGSDYTLTRVNIHSFDDGPRINGNLTITDSFIHGFTAYPGAHYDGMQSTSGSHMLIRHNTIFNEFNQTSAFQLGADTGSIGDVTVDNNLLAGGGYTLYGGQNPRPGFTVTGITITNNRWSTQFYPQSGRFGPVAYVQPGTVWANNAWIDGPNAGKAIAKP